jgi:hypothetical protein
VDHVEGLYNCRETCRASVQVQLYNVICRGAVAIADPTIAHMEHPVSLVGLVHIPNAHA